MANFYEVFKEQHAVLPVVHVTDEAQAVKNAGIAAEYGADGIFLISMVSRGFNYINKVHRVVKSQFPLFWTGVNYLDLIEDPIEVFPNLKPDINGAWLDDAQINPVGHGQLEALRITMAREDSGWKGLYFGGVAFKYRGTVPESELRGLAHIAARNMDVITTSGDKTGNPPDIAKIEALRQGAGSHPLAIASGITAENVHKYLNLTDAFLVATSLLVPHTQDFDPARVKALVEAVHSS